MIFDQVDGGFSPGVMLASVEGKLCVGPLPARDVTPDTVRTAPYSFADLMVRWDCSIDSVERAVGRRFFKIGRTKMVRPAVLLMIEKDMEVGG